jgi:hypothetical protein
VDGGLRRFKITISMQITIRSTAIQIGKRKIVNTINWYPQLWA